MQKRAPVGLLASTAACLVLVNLVVAQGLVQALYPGAGTRIGPAVLGLLALAALASGVYAVVGWRAYLRRRPRA